MRHAHQSRPDNPPPPPRQQKPLVLSHISGGGKHPPNFTVWEGLKDSLLALADGLSCEHWHSTLACNTPPPLHTDTPTPPSCSNPASASVRCWEGRKRFARRGVSFKSPAGRGGGVGLGKWVS